MKVRIKYKDGTEDDNLDVYKIEDEDKCLHIYAYIYVDLDVRVKILNSWIEKRSIKSIEIVEI